jgi:hypothetical protein
MWHLRRALDNGTEILGAEMNKAQIKHMVDRFLTWKLPSNFSPDAGISFKAEYNEHTSRPMRHEPSGTNLLDATQATAMVSHMVEDLPSPLEPRPVAFRVQDRSSGWIIFQNEADAYREAERTGGAMQGMYVQDGH